VLNFCPDWGSLLKQNKDDEEFNFKTTVMKEVNKGEQPDGFEAIVTIIIGLISLGVGVWLFFG
jgi:hypothetical protein